MLTRLGEREGIFPHREQRALPARVAPFAREQPVVPVTGDPVITGAADLQGVAVPNVGEIIELDAFSSRKIGCVEASPNQSPVRTCRRAASQRQIPVCQHAYSNAWRSDLESAKWGPVCYARKVLSER